METLQLSDFASVEEFYFYHWLLEAEQAELIFDWKYQPRKFDLVPRQFVFYEKKLKTKTKQVEKFLFHPHSYTPDFVFGVSDIALSQYFINPSYMSNLSVFVDVKGTWSRDNSKKAYSINRKWVYEKYGVYVETVIPEKFFPKTWVPEICRLSPKIKKPVEKYIGVKTIKEFLKPPG